MSDSNEGLIKYGKKQFFAEGFSSNSEFCLAASSISANYGTEGKTNPPMPPADVSNNSLHFQQAPLTVRYKLHNPTDTHTSENYTLKTTEASNTHAPGGFCEQKYVGTSTELQRRNVKDAIGRYLKYIPRINQASPQNYGSILVDILRETEDEVLLSDFFSMLNTIQVSASNPIVHTIGDRLLQFSSFETKLPGLLLCRLIHDTFTNPLGSASCFGVDTNNPVFELVNAHEFHRSFLAIKVLLHCIKEADGTSETRPSLPKISVFNIYQIYSLKILRANTSSLDMVSSPESLLLGQAGIGKAMKIIFPNIASRRLGRRGCSKYHFAGIEFKEGVVDTEVRLMIDLEPLQVRCRFVDIIKSLKRPEKETPTSKLHTQPQLKNAGRPAGIPDSTTTKPFLSYVGESSIFPDANFAPRVKQIVPNKMPQQSQWFENCMRKSVEVLKHYDVNLEPLINDFQSSTFSAGLETSVCTATISAMDRLVESSSPEGVFLHLHLVILMLVFPAMLASSAEIQPTTKIRLRTDLRRLAETLKERDSNRSLLEAAPQRIFLINLRNLINIGESLMVALPKTLGADILGAMICDLVEIQKRNDFTTQNMIFDDVCSHAAVTVLKALPRSFPSDEKEKLDLIMRITELFQEIFRNIFNNLQIMLAEIKLVNGDAQAEMLPFVVFKIFSEALNELLESEPCFSTVPIAVLGFFFSQFNLEIQAANFKKFGERETVVSTESFKTWWVITSSLRGYFTVLSEIAVLSQRLA